MDYKTACELAKRQSLPTAADPKGCCTKYVECQIIPGQDPLAEIGWHINAKPSVNQQAYFTTDWYSGACVACYHDGKWRDLR